MGSQEKPATITERIDNITRIRDECLSDTPPCPKSVKIELTALCNFSCQFCARSKHLREVGQIDRHFFEELLVDLLRAGVEELGLFYLGESFIVPWLPDAISSNRAPASRRLEIPTRQIWRQRADGRLAMAMRRCSLGLGELGIVAGVGASRIG